MNHNDDKDNSFKQIADMFYEESEILIKSVKDALENAEMQNIREIVQIYYQVINVSSMISALEPRLYENDGHEKLLQKIKNTGEIIENEFNSNIHPAITAQLSEKIRESTNSLKEIKKNRRRTKKQRNHRKRGQTV